MNSRHSFLLALSLLSLIVISPATCFPQQPSVKKETTTDPNSIDYDTNTSTMSHAFGPSEQLCGLTWSNEAIRGKFQTTSTPPTFYCKNSGGSSYRCGRCGLVSSPSPIGPSDRKTMTTMSGKAYSCTAKNEKGISVQVGDSTCIAYSIADGGAGTIHCLSPTFEYLECSIGVNFPKFDAISCTDCLLYEADESDQGGIFGSSAP
ncbi:secreted protein [Melampsora americana]|nr:secreted protein [Melampsora americana]